MNKHIKITAVVAFFILGLTSCDSDFLGIGDEKNYMYCLEYAEYSYYSSAGELMQTIVIDNQYDENKLLSSTMTMTYGHEQNDIISTIQYKYEYTDLTCCRLTYINSRLHYEETIEYLDDSYRHIKCRRTKVRNVEDAYTSVTYSDTENIYDGKCITQSKEQYYVYHNNETTPRGSSVTTYNTNGLHQIGKTQNFDVNGNLTDTSLIEYTYLNDEYCDYIEYIVKDSKGNESSRTEYVYDTSNRITENRGYSDGKLYTQQIFAYDGDNCVVSGFSGDLTMEGVARYIKISY